MASKRLVSVVVFVVIILILIWAAVRLGRMKSSNPYFKNIQRKSVTYDEDDFLDIQMDEDIKKFKKSITTVNPFITTFVTTNIRKRSKEAFNETLEILDDQPTWIPKNSSDPTNNKLPTETNLDTRIDLLKLKSNIDFVQKDNKDHNSFISLKTNNFQKSDNFTNQSKITEANATTDFPLEDEKNFSDDKIFEVTMADYGLLNFQSDTLPYLCKYFLLNCTKEKLTTLRTLDNVNSDKNNNSLTTKYK